MKADPEQEGAERLGQEGHRRGGGLVVLDGEMHVAGGAVDGDEPMARNIARANGGKSKVRAAVEHVFARQKEPMGLVMRKIGLARARMKIGLANLTYNMNRAVWLTGSRARTA